ncbi:MAG: ECF transporter S component [Lachnospiraceae bacterium]|nr:ECF transporter S component [Lachnospiraceae bacterium]
MNNQRTKKLALSAMLLAVGLVLPLFTGQIPQVGNMLLPMHIPVFLCGLICGWKYGLAIGFITPLLRSAVFGVPILFPSAIAMAFELMTYGFVIGFLYNRCKWKCILSLYRSMLAAMLSGRIVWGFVQILLLGIGTEGFTLQAFFAGAFFNAVPGIILQLILIPSLMLALNKTGLVTFKKHKKEVHAYVHK